VPTLPVTSHDSHWPPQALLQHTPSTQESDEHSVAEPHASPLGLRGVHTPAAQNSPFAQLVSMTHSSLSHTVPLHWPDGQACD
jgi:hypothetical protein